MKNRLITGILFVILGGIISLGPQTIFPVCGVHTAKHAETENSREMDELKNMGEEGHKNDQTTENTGENAPATMKANTVMRCHWTAQAEIGLGIEIALLGFLLFVFRSRQIRLGLSLALILNGILTMLVPTVLIGVCDSEHMVCRSLTLPALVILASTVIVISVVNVFFLLNSKSKGMVGT